MHKDTVTHLRLLHSSHPAPPIMRAIGDCSHLFKIFELEVITEAEFWTIASAYPDFMQYLAWKDQQRQPQRSKRAETMAFKRSQPTMFDLLDEVNEG